MVEYNNSTVRLGASDVVRKHPVKAIIMVGTIILPIMLSLGLSPFVAAGVFLIGVCAGGSLNPTGWALYRDTLNVETGTIQQFALLLAVLYILTGGVFAWLWPS